MSDLDTIQIVQRQDSNTDSVSGRYQSVDFEIDPKTYVSAFGNNFQSKEHDYAKFVFESELALEFGQKPKLSKQGTSGCYFLYNRIGVSVWNWIYCLYNYLTTYDSAIHMSRVMTKPVFRFPT